MDGMFASDCIHMLTMHIQNTECVLSNNLKKNNSRPRIECGLFSISRVEWKFPVSTLEI